MKKIVQILLVLAILATMTSGTVFAARDYYGDISFDAGDALTDYTAYQAEDDECTAHWGEELGESYIWLDVYVNDDEGKYTYGECTQEELEEIYNELADENSWLFKSEIHFELFDLKNIEIDGIKGVLVDFSYINYRITVYRFTVNGKEYSLEFGCDREESHEEAVKIFAEIAETIKFGMEPEEDYVPVVKGSSVDSDTGSKILAVIILLIPVIAVVAVIVIIKKKKGKKSKEEKAAK